jgi:hypothetical protein
MALQIPSAEEAALNHRSSIAEEVYGCIARGESSLSSLPTLISTAIEIDAWKERKSRLGTIWRLDSFREWVERQPPIGLGSSYQQICNLLRDNDKALAAVRRAWGVEIDPHGGKRNAGESQVDSVKLPSASGGGGNSSDYLRARLARDADPKRSKLSADDQQKAAAVLAEVDTGKVRPSAAAKKMGYRKDPTPIDIIERTWGKATPEQRTQIAEKLGMHLGSKPQPAEPSPAESDDAAVSWRVPRSPRKLAAYLKGRLSPAELVELTDALAAHRHRRRQHCRPRWSARPLRSRPSTGQPRSLSQTATSSTGQRGRLRNTRHWPSIRIAAAVTDVSIAMCRTSPSSRGRNSMRVPLSVPIFSKN